MRIVLQSLFTAVLLLLFMWLLYRLHPEHIPDVVRLNDTIYVRDTIRDTVPVPVKTYITRYDTILISTQPRSTGISSDSTKSILHEGIETIALIPIEIKQYRTKDYCAVIEGYKPKLLQMELYNTNAIINNSKLVTKQPRLQFGIGAGVSYDPFSRKLYPAITAGIYIPLFTIK